MSEKEMNSYRFGYNVYKNDMPNNQIELRQITKQKHAK